jgi:hypothetical protein
MQRWPAIPVAGWQDTRDTLHLYAQVVGKVRLANEALANHWWNVPLHVTARGLTTSLMPHPTGAAFQIDFDFVDHRLDITTVDGAVRSLDLGPRPVADFYHAVMGALGELGVATTIWPMPVEIPDAIAFPDDRAHASYDPEAVNRFWRALVEMERVFKVFGTRFVGKASPIHVFWGALDLAATRFSGRTAPPHPGGVPNCGPHVMWEAYSHEVSSAGYESFAPRPTPTSSCSSSSRAPTRPRPPRRAGTGRRSNDPTEVYPVADSCTHLGTVTEVASSSDGGVHCSRARWDRAWRS